MDQTSPTAGGLALALASASAWALWRARGAGVPFLLRYAVGVALGLLLASIQLLPFIENARLSAVLATRETWMAPMSASFRSAINLLMPYYYGSPTGGDYWGEWNFNETAVAVGLAPWLLLRRSGIGRGRRLASLSPSFHSETKVWCGPG